LEVAGAPSTNGELTRGPRLTAADHSENFGAAEMEETMRKAVSNWTTAMLVVRTRRFMASSLSLSQEE
jgi:hypothetical protein